MRCACAATLDVDWTASLCPACHVLSGAPLPSALAATSPVWLWTSRHVGKALASGDLGVILRAYRAATGLSQAALAEQLGYDRTYLTMIENGRRSIANVSDLRRLAQHLGVPPYVVGVTDDAHEDTSAMIMFGESTVRLASTARQAGHAAEAINELWPLIWRMESRLATGRADYNVARLLGSARVALGVALGDVLTLLANSRHA